MKRILRIPQMFHGAKSILFTLAFAGSLSATEIKFNPAPTTTAGWSNCANYAGYLCKTTAYFDSDALSFENKGGVLDPFQTAFNAWTDSGGGKGWTDMIAPKNKDLGGTFNVTIAKAEQFGGSLCENVVANDGTVVCGGLEISVTLSDVTLPHLGDDDQLVWVQGLKDNYGGNVAPTYEMDITSAGCHDSGPKPWCPPAYPYQHADHHFYDQPHALYRSPGTTQAFFVADAYLAVENNTTKFLTLYDGFTYRFQNYVSPSPEPSAWILMVSGLVIVLLYRRRAVTGISR